MREHLGCASERQVAGAPIAVRPNSTVAGALSAAQANGAERDLIQANRRIVARLKRLSVRGAAAVHDHAGNGATATGRFRLTAPAKPKRGR